jgi:hypothetical protein
MLGSSPVFRYDLNNLSLTFTRKFGVSRVDEELGTLDNIAAILSAG